MYYAVIKPSATCLEDKLIGYHEKKKVATQYYYSLKTLDDGYKYKLVKCKKKQLKKIPSYQDHYLIRFGRNYIPSIYYEFAKEDIYTVLFEYTHTMEILQRIFELEKLSTSDKKILEEAIFIINDQYEKEKDCVMDPNTFSQMKEMYESWQRKTIYAEPLNEDELKILEEVSEIINSNITVDCTKCRYCVDSCPEEIDIAKLFDLYNKHKLLDIDEWTQFGNAYLNYSKLEGVGIASDCTECETCIEECPQQINIPEVLKDVAKTFENEIYGFTD